MSDGGAKYRRELRASFRRLVRFSSWGVADDPNQLAGDLIDLIAYCRVTMERLAELTGGEFSGRVVDTMLTMKLPGDGDGGPPPAAH